jgi:hypothetical protein
VVEVVETPTKLTTLLVEMVLSVLVVVVKD